MHLGLIGVVLGLSVCIRCQYLLDLWSTHNTPVAAWAQRWRLSLLYFVLPPLLLLSTLIAVLCMGTQGTMLGQSVSWVGNGVAILLLIVAFGRFISMSWQRWRTQQFLQDCEPVVIQQQTAYQLQTLELFAGQVGLFKPQLIMSQGLLQQLDDAQIEAILCHERAHVVYQDLFWFFWLSCLRDITGWLPATQVLYQELLLLREQRADAWATQYVDALLLAETLLQVAASAPQRTIAYGIGLYGSEAIDRLDARIEMLLTSNCIEQIRVQPSFHLIWLTLATLPFLSLLLHF